MPGTRLRPSLSNLELPECTVCLERTMDPTKPCQKCGKTVHTMCSHAGGLCRQCFKPSVVERENKERTLREQREATRRREHELRVAAVESRLGSVHNWGDGDSHHADRDDDEDEDIDEPASEVPGDEVVQADKKERGKEKPDKDSEKRKDMAAGASNAGNGLERGHNDQRMQSRVNVLICMR